MKTKRPGGGATGPMCVCMLILVLVQAPAQAVTMNWNTFMGSAGVDGGYGMAVDGSGNVYVTGEAEAAWGTPVNAHAGGSDAFVAKFDSTGALVWNTFMGSANNDYGLGLAVDGSGNVYVSGRDNATWGTPINPHAGGFDACVAKLDSSGNLVWNTFMGSAGDDNANNLVVDGSGNVYVTGYCTASWGTPINAYAGDRDGFLAKLDSSGNLVWNTFMGSAGSDVGYAIAAGGSGNLYVEGYSPATWGTPVNAHAGGFDAFVAKFDSSGNRLWNTFMGSAGIDYGYAIAADASGNPYVAGASYATWGTPVNAHAGGADGFVAKFDSSGNRLWNTFMGSAVYDGSFAIAAGGAGNVYVAGDTYATWGNPIHAYTGDYDAYLAKLDSSGKLVWNTFMGSAVYDGSYAIAAGGAGTVYVAGAGDATWGSPVNAYAGGTDAFATKFTDCFDADGDGYGTGPGCLVADCNDADNAIYPGAAETCNGKDDDCDKQTDEGLTTAYYRDADGDGYGDADNATQACGAPAGFVTDNSDCNDTDSFLHDICPECTVRVIPQSLGWFLGEKERTRTLIVIGKRETVFVENTEIRWDSPDILFVSKRVFFKRFMLMRVRLDGAALDKGNYRVLIGTCSGTLKLVE
jgi:hypothetical protein